MTSREAMLFMKYEHYGKCKGSFKDPQRKCNYYVMNTRVLTLSAGTNNVMTTSVTTMHFSLE